MTKRELSQLYYLNREIACLQDRIAELECRATSCTSHITGMPKGKCISDIISNYAIEIADLKSYLDLSLKKCFYELNCLNRYIQGINDSEIRMILSLRYLNGLSWQQIAYSIGTEGDGSTERKKHDRFLKNS
jgi:hypothetical protein